MRNTFCKYSTPQNYRLIYLPFPLNITGCLQYQLSSEEFFLGWYMFKIFTVRTELKLSAISYDNNIQNLVFLHLQVYSSHKISLYPQKK